MRILISIVVWCFSIVVNVCDWITYGFKMHPKPPVLYYPANLHDTVKHSVEHVLHNRDVIYYSWAHQIYMYIERRK